MRWRWCARAVCVSYAELDARAKRLARVLAARGAGPEPVVAVVLERSVELVVAMLGVLKAGAAYLPVDPGYPAERVRVHAGRRGAGGGGGWWRGRGGGGGAGGGADGGRGRRRWLAGLAGLGLGSAAGRVRGGASAYVIYTSGSTGVPKGVVVSHAGFGEPGWRATGLFGVGAGDRVLGSSRRRVLTRSGGSGRWRWLSGAALVIVPRRRRLGAGLAGFLGEEGVTHVTLPPAVLAVLDAGLVSPGTVVVTAGRGVPAGGGGAVVFGGAGCSTRTGRRRRRWT